MYRDGKKEFRLFLSAEDAKKRDRAVNRSGLPAYVVDAKIYRYGLRNLKQIQFLVGGSDD